MTAILTPAPALTGVDRIVSLDPGRGAIALRNVPATLDIFDSHFPRFPVLPGVLILASLAELCAALLAETSGGAWQLAAARTVRYRHFVRPGDTMLLETEMIEPGVCAARVLVDGKRVTTIARLEFCPAESGGAAWAA